MDKAHRFRTRAAGFFTWICIAAAPAAVTTAAGAADPSPDDLDPVTVHEAPSHAPVPLVVDGEARAVMHVAGSGGEAFAGLSRELPDAIEATTGAKLERVRDMPAADQPAIIVGDCPASRAAGIDAADIPIEGFVIKTAANRVFIVGSTKPVEHADNEGLAWGIADFLERLVGVRWYWPLAHHGRSVIKTDTLRVEPVHYTDAPAYRMRVGWPPAHRGTPFGTLRAHELYQRLRSGNSWPHQIAVHWPRVSEWYEVYGESRPEIFAIRSDGSRNRGMFCYGDPATVETFVQNIALHYKGDADGHKTSFIRGRTISVSPPDQAVQCRCADCQALLEPSQASQFATASRLMADFTRRLAEKVEKRWPEMTVLYQPYSNYTLAPDIADMPDNVEVQLCGMPGLAMYKEPEVWAEFQGNIDRWAALTTGKVQTWDYPCWPTDRTRAPYQYPGVLQKFYRHNRDKLVGSFLNGTIDTDEWVSQHITMYLWMKLLWDPEIDVDAVMKAFSERMFADAADPVHDILTILTERWEQADWPGGAFDPKVMYTHSYPKPVIERIRSLLAEAKQRVAGDALASQRFEYFHAAYPLFFAEYERVMEGKGKQQMVLRKVAEDPTVDGRLDEKAWQQAEAVELVVRRGDGEGKPAHPTKVMGVFSREGLTFAFRMAEPAPDKLVTGHGDTDQGALWLNDCVEIFLDPAGDEANELFQLIVTADLKLYHARGRNGKDTSWNPEGVKVARQVGADHWTLEVFIPLSELPGDDRLGTTQWMGQLTRHRAGHGKPGIGENQRLNFMAGRHNSSRVDFSPLIFREF